MREHKKVKRRSHVKLKPVYKSAENRYRKPPKEKEKRKDESVSKTTSQISPHKQEPCLPDFMFSGDIASSQITRRVACEKTFSKTGKHIVKPKRKSR